MLINLHVKNLALIEETEADFGPGLNILTGETGAGKSLLLGSINLVLGKKMTKDLLRQGSDSCLVELVFRPDTPESLQRLAALGIEAEDGHVILTRKLQKGRSISRINGETCTAARMKEAAALLLDVHGQHEHQSLLYPQYQLGVLDDYGREQLEAPAAAVAETYQAYQALKKELEDYALGSEEVLRQISFLQFEIEEIEAAALHPGEEDTLEQRYRLLTNSRKIGSALQEAHGYTGNDGGAGEMVGRALRELSSIAGFDPSLAESEKLLADIEDLLNDLNRQLSSYMTDFVFSEEEFRETEDRLDIIRRIKGKYGQTEEKVEAALQARKRELDRLQNYEERKQILQDRLDSAEKKLEKATAQLTEARKKVAAELSAAIRKELEGLNFQNTDFEILFSRNSSYSARGADTVSYQISTNPGEPRRSLDKVASGGELSRVMLAIKTLLADRDQVETLIFDEIDTGISGRTAQKISEKLAKIAGSRQVICITHLAQIASMADRHFVIEKCVREQETLTQLRQLSEEEQTGELARILGGAEITDAVRQNAAEMRQLALDRKKTICREKRS